MARPTLISTDTLLAALAARLDATAADLAGAVGIGQSTSAKRLAALEAAGTVQRIPGGRSDTGRRAADRWSLTPLPPTPGSNGPAESGTPSAPAAASPTPATVSADGSGRLGRGALGTMVLDYLTTRPGEAFGPSAIAKALDRSAGAISNSLDAMAVRGQVELVSNKPRRYRMAGAK